jgi:putative hydrolase of the HAD superfamily
VRRVTAVLFDLDDTLYPEREYVLSGYRAVAWFAGSRYGRSARDVESLLVRRLEQHGRAGAFDALARTLGQPEAVPALLHVYRTHRPRIRPYPDVRPALARLRERGVRLGVVTDGKATVQHYKLEALGLEEHFDVVVASDDIDTAKPAAEPFEVACTRLGSVPGDAVYVGDDPAKDFVGPRGLGMATIRVDRGWPHPLQHRRDFPPDLHADETVADLTAVADLVTGAMRAVERSA